MNVTTMVAGLLGVVVPPVMVAKAFATPYPAKAAMFGFLAAVAFLGAVALLAWTQRERVRRWSA